MGIHRMYIKTVTMMANMIINFLCLLKMYLLASFLTTKIIDKLSKVLGRIWMVQVNIKRYPHYVSFIIAKMLLLLLCRRKCWKSLGSHHFWNLTNWSSIRIFNYFLIRLRTFQHLICLKNKRYTIFILGNKIFK